MKKNLTVLTSLILASFLALLAFGCAEEQKMRQPMDAKMETMKKEPMNQEQGVMEKPDLKKDMTGSMAKPKSM